MTYSWDEGTGGTYKVENLTSGATHQEATSPNLTLDMGTTYNEPFVFGADQIYSGNNTADTIANHFDGTIDYVSLFDTVEDPGGPYASDHVVDGTAGDDVIDAEYTGDPEGDMVDANDAADGSNDDVIDGGAGADTITGGSGDDSIDGGAGADTLDGGAGSDSIHGGDNNDTIDGGDGDDTITGGAGDDLLTGGAGADTFTMSDGGGNDTITDFEAPTDNGDGTFTATDQLDVSGLTDAGGNPVNVADVTVTDTNGDGTGDAILTFPGGESITLTGVQAGDVSNFTQLAALGIPANSVDGTAGNNHITVGYTDADGDSITDDAEVIIGGDGNDIISGSGGADTIYGGDGNDHLMGYRWWNDPGNDGDDLLVGGAGNDTIEGNSGDDSLIGGSGADTMDGGAGNDTLSYAGDTTGVNVDLGAGTASGGDATGDVISNLENLTGGSGDDTLTGDAGANVIDGGDGDDTIDGGSGDDSIDGGSGDDEFILGPTIDNDIIIGGEAAQNGAGDRLDLSSVTDDITVTFSADEAGTLTDGISTTSFSEIEVIELGSGNDSVTGSVGNDNVSGGAGSDTIDLGAGTDRVDGGAGDDTIIVAEGDAVSGGDGDDTFLVTDHGEAGTNNATITGGEGGETAGDTLDFQGLTHWGDITYTNADPNVDGGMSGTATLADGSVVTFSEIENIIVCFVAGTLIATPNGPRKVEDLGIGDLVSTLSGPAQPVIWQGRQHLDTATLAARPDLRPVRIRKGALRAVRHHQVV